mmetsp:Transcript_12918/g.20024  ORF Transcript_12918/g.20024 Transcript_12918/m.20024 type:complete len:335 (-) Transcript_12918:51-1055(-)
MRFAVVAALIGLSAAAMSDQEFNDLITMPEWEVNPQCKYRLQKEALDINTAIKKMPMTYNANSTAYQRAQAVKHRKAVLAVAKYFKAIDDSCHDTKKGFFCPNSSQLKIKTEFVHMRNALDACHSVQANALKKEIFQFFKLLDHCTTVIRSNEKVLLKVTLPKEGQDKLEDEWEDVEVELRKLHANPHWHAIKENLKEWGETPEAKHLDETLDSYGKSAEGQKLIKELKEAIDTLDKDIKEIPDGFEIDNDDLNEIKDEIDDAGDELDKLDTSAWGRKIEDAGKAAFDEAHWKKVEQEFEAWTKTPDAKKLAEEVEDIDDVFDDYLKVEDLPQH